MQHDTRNPEDIDTQGEDHAADETRYALFSRPFSKKAPRPKKIKGHLDMSLDELFKAHENNYYRD